MARPDRNSKEFQFKFAREYYKTNNAEQSAIAAGWTPITARSKSHELPSLVGVQKHLKEMEEKARKKFDLSEEKIVSELMKVGFANMQEV